MADAFARRARTAFLAHVRAAVLCAALATCAGAATDSTAARPSSDEPWDVNVPHAPSDTLRFERHFGRKTAYRRHAFPNQGKCISTGSMLEVGVNRECRSNSRMRRIALST